MTVRKGDRRVVAASLGAYVGDQFYTAPETNCTALGLCRSGEESS